MAFPRDKIIKFLNGSFLFKNLKSPQIIKILGVAKSQKYSPFSAIFTKDRPSDSFIILIQGSIAIQHGNQVIAQLNPFSIIGEMGILLGEPRSANVVSIDNTECLFISKEDLEKLFKNDLYLEKTILTNLIKALSQKVQESNNAISKLLQQKSDLDFQKTAKKNTSKNSSDINEVGKEILDLIPEEEPGEQEDIKNRRTNERLAIPKDIPVFIQIDQLGTLLPVSNISGNGLEFLPVDGVFMTELENLSGKLILETLPPMDISLIIRWVNENNVGCEISKFAIKDFSALNKYIDDKMVDFLESSE